MLCNNDILIDTQESAKFPVHIRRSAEASVTFGLKDLSGGNHYRRRGISAVLALGGPGATTLSVGSFNQLDARYSRKPLAVPA
jgi:hypothetical protein